MTKKLDPRLIEILTKYGEDVEAAIWDCHGTWVVYHKAIERIAARAGITYENPSVLVAEREAAAILVTGKMGDKAEWSIGEAAINLNYKVSGRQAAYPFAMAEKRAKDRVVLKLVGLHGLAYSEEESDSFKPDARSEQSLDSYEKPLNLPPARSSSSLKKDGAWDKLMSELQNDFVDCHSTRQLQALRVIFRQRALSEGWPKAWLEALKNEFDAQEDALKKAELITAGE